MTGSKSCARFAASSERAFTLALLPFLATLLIAQRYPPSRVPLAFCSGQCGLCAGAYSGGFMLRQRGHDMQSEFIRLRQIDGFKLHPGFHEIGDKGDVPGQSVQFRYQERCPVQAAQRQGAGSRFQNLMHSPTY